MILTISRKEAATLVEAALIKQHVTQCVMEGWVQRPFSAKKAAKALDSDETERVLKIELGNGTALNFDS